MKSKYILLIGSLMAIVSTGCQKQPATVRGLSPEESLATFEVAEGFQIEQIAAEPLVSDPVDMEIDEYGRLYVVEMHGYPLDKEGSGSVKLLEDTDGDGKMDKSIVFADNLVLPTGVMRWKKGILVSDAPDIWYFEDTDGDGKADVKEVMLTGFALANPQHNVNNPLLGLDNWIYLGHEPAATAKVYTDYFSDRGSDVYFPAHADGPKLPENALGRSVRFNPDKVLLENLSSQTQFGHTFDPWGRRFLVSNAHHIYQEVFKDRYLRRNEALLISNTIESISDHGNAADVYPITKNPEHQLLTDVGVFTAACGITSYTGGLFPSIYDRVTFVAEPVGNLVHADVLRDRGVTFTASRLFEKKEFLASTDAWFRPVNLYVGPDGALYVVDYYRQIIEHPEWMADDVAKSGAIYNGIDQGRIYRITPKGTPKLNWSNRLKLGDGHLQEWVDHLASPNAWWRGHAQRLLVDRKDKAAIPLLEKLVGSAESPLARLHALWTLHGMDALTSEVLIQGLHDTEAGVRENAIRMSEDRFLMKKSAETDRVVAELIKLKNDSSPKVRFQLLASLGFVDTPIAAKTRKDLLFENLDDRWMQIATLSATPFGEDNLLEEVLQRSRPGDTQYASLIERLSNLTGATGNMPTIKLLINRALVPGNTPHWATAALAGLTQSLRNRAADKNTLAPERERLLATALNSPDAALRRSAMNLLRVIGLPENEGTADAIAKAVANLQNTALDAEKRAESMELLTISGPEKYVEILQNLITPAEPISVQSAALNALSSIPDTTVSGFLIKRWASLTPSLREQAIGTFLGSEPRISQLLDALEAGVVDPSVISWPRQVGLMANGNEHLRNRARDLLADKNASHQEVIKTYQEALTLTGNPENGKQLFAVHCAMCHQIGGKNGVFYGPDLASIRNRRPQSIMADILNPNLSIADGYDIWNIELKSGETLQGLIASETPSAITVRNYGAVERVISRNEIHALTAMGVSVMTAGFNQLIDKQQMADLLSYLRQSE
ncbi:PVC-type heme-binding CxxCH protein [Parapedobacter sp. GCM10030251]|uniref:PVC-type heme-binding CxxCH protein n=1 Tax=Parapedobacter sp. GCM10030251 TaxID=3273419 RepID=UPI0036239B1E